MDYTKGCSLEEVYNVVQSPTWTMTLRPLGFVCISIESGQEWSSSTYLCERLEGRDVEKKFGSNFGCIAYPFQMACHFLQWKNNQYLSKHLEITHLSRYLTFWSIQETLTTQLQK